MAIFFFLIGLEIKRELMEGELSSLRQVALPAAGAIGGMLVPALVYFWLNRGDARALEGWAIPVATDIAFAVALLGAFGARVPLALKVFLMTLAISDDMAAIAIIAIFYSANLSEIAIVFAVLALAVGIGMNRLGVTRTSSYVVLGIILWVAVLKSGVHATLAGILIAFCVPMRDREGGSPLKSLETNLHGTVSYFVLPVFAFANAGLALSGLSLSDILAPVPLGVTLGLFVGKPAGIMLFVGAAVALGIARLPDGTSWPQILGAACTCGIGFTMSLFIAGLAFENAGTGDLGADRLGILIGSILSAIAALLVLKLALPSAQSALRSSD
jgi:NhaA family Na+:H+ antiporter